MKKIFVLLLFVIVLFSGSSNAQNLSADQSTGARIGKIIGNLAISDEQEAFNKGFTELIILQKDAGLKLKKEGILTEANFKDLLESSKSSEAKVALLAFIAKFKAIASKTKNVQDFEAKLKSYVVTSGPGSYIGCITGCYGALYTCLDRWLGQLGAMCWNFYHACLDGCTQYQN